MPCIPSFPQTNANVESYTHDWNLWKDYYQFFFVLMNGREARREIEISEHQVAVVLEEYALWLQIFVHDPLLVKIHLHDIEPILQNNPSMLLEL